MNFELLHACRKLQILVAKLAYGCLSIRGDLTSTEAHGANDAKLGGHAGFPGADSVVLERELTSARGPPLIVQCARL